MKKYIESLKDKPDYHKERFALLVSGIFTLAIFGVWSFVTFNKTVDVPVATVQQAEYEPSPLSSLRSNFSSAFEAIRSNTEELKGAIENYGQ